MKAISEAEIQAELASFNRIPIVTSLLDVICRTTGMGFAAVARVTDTKWIAYAVNDNISFGLKPGEELKLETTICNEIRQSHQPVIIDHVARDNEFINHHTPAMYGFQSYISVPIILKNGDFYGTLCALDPRPAQLKKPEVLQMFKLFADLISYHLNTVQQLEITNDELLKERNTSETREQFIAILGHDLRNPLGAVLNSAELINSFSSDTRISRIAGIIKNSAYRMSGLIENILDFAKGRLGGGITLDIKPAGDLEKILQQVVAELRAVWPEQQINLSVQLDESVYCDEARIAQLFSNLLNNAIIHGSKTTPVEVNATNCNGEFILTVTNGGGAIPEIVMKRLFQPFYRGDIKPGKQGLGLGLYISSELAKAHNGNLSVVSNNEQTTFTFKMPLKP